MQRQFFWESATYHDQFTHANDSHVNGLIWGIQIEPGQEVVRLLNDWSPTAIAVARLF